MSDDFDPTEPADALQMLGGVAALVSVALAWFGATNPGPVDPTVPGYETIYGLLAAVVAFVALVVIVAGLGNRADGVAILGGAVVALLAVARFVTLGETQSAGIGLYLAVIGGVVMAVGGVLGPD